MSAIAARSAAIALLVVALAAGGFYVKALRAELADAQDAARTAQEAVSRRDDRRPRAPSARQRPRPRAARSEAPKHRGRAIAVRN
jgi:uncharacterized protein HemX